MMMNTTTVKTWRERIGAGPEFPLHAPTDVERAMEAEIAELRAQIGKANSSAPTDLSKQLRQAAIAEVSYADARLLIGAAEEVERYYGGMLAWKQTAEKKDRDWNEVRMARENERCAARAQQGQQVPSIDTRAFRELMQNLGYWTEDEDDDCSRALIAHIDARLRQAQQRAIGEECAA